MLTVLANRTYRHLFLAQVVALVGTGLATVALGLLAFELAGADADAGAEVCGNRPNKVHSLRGFSHSESVRKPLIFNNENIAGKLGMGNEIAQTSADLGAGGRSFEYCRPDQLLRVRTRRHNVFGPA